MTTRSEATACFDTGIGEVIPNGIALCKLHHGAFDAHLMTVRPDYRIEVRRDVLEESDGPMLIHGLQGFHGQRLDVPARASLRPNPSLLETRYELFRRSADRPRDRL